MSSKTPSSFRRRERRVAFLAALPLAGFPIFAGCGAGAVERPAPTPIRSTFNGLELDPGGPWSEYTFAVIGHIRGGREGPQPAPTLQDHVGRVTAIEPRFVVCLGDLFHRADPEMMAGFRAWTEASVPVPFFNAVGNHDIQVGGAPLADGTVTPRSYDHAPYVREFGPTWFEFTLGSELFVFLDLEYRGFKMEADQLAWFEEVVERATDDDSLRNVFFFSHKVVWSYHDPRMDALFRYRHPVPVPDHYSFYADRMKPLLVELAADKDVYLFAGDIGGGYKHLQMYYHRDEHFTYVATGMGAPPRDCFVEVNVADGAVTMRSIRLESGKASRVESHGNEAWEAFYRKHPKHAEAARFQ